MAKWQSVVDTATEDNYRDAPATLERMCLSINSGIEFGQDYTQNASLLTTYINAADFFQDTGTANAYRLIADSGRKEVYENVNGGLIRFRPAFPNDGASTVSVGEKPIVEIVAESGLSLVGGELTTTKDAFIRFDSSLNKYILLGTFIQEQINLNTAHISTLQGLVIPASTTIQGLQFLDKKINLTYSTSTSLLYSSGSFDLDDGTGQGVLIAGSVDITTFYPTPANNTPYYVFAVKNLTTNATTVIISNSRTSPAFPSGFTKKAYIGALMTNGSGQITSGTWVYGKGVYEFYYATRINNVSLSTPPVGTNTYPISVPISNSLIAITVLMANAGVTGSDSIKGNFGSPDELFTETDEDAVDFSAIGSDGRTQKVPKDFPTSTSMVKIQITESAGARNLILFTRGWKEYL